MIKDKILEAIEDIISNKMCYRNDEIKQDGVNNVLYEYDTQEKTLNICLYVDTLFLTSENRVSDILMLENQIETKYKNLYCQVNIMVIGEGRHSKSKELYITNDMEIFCSLKRCQNIFLMSGNVVTWSDIEDFYVHGVKLTGYVEDDEQPLVFLSDYQRSFYDKLIKKIKEKTYLSMQYQEQKDVLYKLSQIISDDIEVVIVSVDDLDNEELSEFNIESMTGKELKELFSPVIVVNKNDKKQKSQKNNTPNIKLLK